MLNVVYREPFGSATAPSDVDGAIAPHGLDVADFIIVLGIPDGIAWQECGRGGHRRLVLVSLAHRSPLNWRARVARHAANAWAAWACGLFAAQAHQNAPGLTHPRQRHKPSQDRCPVR
jgi:hypothetical protein